MGVFHHPLCDNTRLLSVRPTPSGIVYRLSVMMKRKTGIVFCRAWKNEQPIVVKKGVGNCDQRFVTAAVVPAECLCGDPPNFENVEDALQITDYMSFVILIRHLVEKACGRKLLAIPYYDHLLTTQHSSEGIGRPNLAGLIEDDQIEGVPSSYFG